MFGQLLPKVHIICSFLQNNLLGFLLGEFSANPSGQPGTDVLIFKIFSPKNLAKILAFFAQTTASFLQKL
jgi:hypothetical protein